MKKFISFVLSLTLLLSLASCVASPTVQNGTEQPEATKIEITDYSGKKYTLTQPPHKVCCLSPVAMEILLGLGITRAIGAVDENIAALPNCPDDAQQITLDANLPSHLKLLGVDAVMYENDLSDEMMTVFEQGGILTFKIASEGSIADAYSNIRLVSSIMFRADQGEELIEEMRDKIELVKTMAHNLPERSTFYAEIGTPDSIKALGTNTLITELIEIAGGDNIYADRLGPFTTTDAETVSKNPAVMISFVRGEKFNVSTVRARPGYDLTEASKMGRIYVFDSSIPIRPSLSLTDALFEIAYLLDTMPRSN